MQTKFKFRKNVTTKKIASQFVKIKPKHLLNDSQLGHKKKLGKEKMQNMNPKLQMNYITQEKPIYIYIY